MSCAERASLLFYELMFVLPDSSEIVAELLERAVSANAGSLNVLDAERVELIGQVIDSGAWEGWGIRSVHHWVTLHCGVSSAHAHQLVASARRLSELPETRARFAAGALSADQVAVIARSAPAYADAEVAELATHTAVPQLRSVLRRYIAWRTARPGQGTSRACEAFRTSPDAAQADAPNHPRLFS